MRLRSIPLLAVLAVLAALPTTALAQPGAASPIFINEIHYDNTGTDAGEAIEVVAPEGTNLVGYSIVLYNGMNGASYDSKALSGTVGASKTVTQNYLSNGIQNGAPDGVALIGPGDVVIQFLSYEGTFTAVGGLANGVVSTSIGFSENGSEPTGMSLQLAGSGDSYGDFMWQSVRASSFGALNVGQTYTGTGGGDPPPPAACAGAIDPISEVQGPGDATPCAGQVVAVEGIVTGDFQGASNLNGVFIQDPTPDEDPNTSEGIFVFDPNAPALAVGDRVRITGTAVEFFGLTQITTVTATEVLESGVALPAATTLDLPADTAARERLEGMRIVAPGTLTVTESRNADNFGELKLSSGGVLFTPTEVAEPGPAAAAIAAENVRRSIILDDAKSAANPRPVPYVGPLDSLRRGDTTSGLTGILSYGFGQYRVQPTTEPTFTENNPRPAAPDDVGGDIQIGSFNVLNYFITFGRSEDRGADSETEFAQQEAKIVDAINGLGAEIVALQEIQDTSDEAAFANDPDAALDRLVVALNADPDSDLVWAKVPAPSPYANTDEIRNAIIYQPSKVERVGEPGALNDPAFANARTPLSQTFRAGAETFTVIANHFKSKSGTGTGDNANTGQGSFNGDRVRQATALLGYIRDLQVSTGDPDVLALGDLNSYTREDPIDVLIAGGLVDVAATRIAEADRYSFVFDGAQGNLDHEIATPELAAKLTGADIWHINADEPDAFQYTGPEEFFALDAYAASDHDPSLVGLEIGEEPNRAPVADLIVSPSSGEEPLGVVFDGSGSSDPDGVEDLSSYSLAFGDGSAPATGSGRPPASISHTYTSPGSYTATLTVTDAVGESAEDSVSVTVSQANRAPVARPDEYSQAGSDTSLVVSAAQGVLANDSDADGDTLSAALISGPASGMLTLDEDGSFSYRANADFVGVDSFSYRAGDGKAQSEAVTVSITVAAGCEGKRATIVGTNGADSLSGTAGDDVIVALGGNDKLYGQGANDTLCAGAGVDKVDAGLGNDVIDGGEGEDDINGNQGDDTIDGGGGNDYLQGERGNDTIRGGAGNDRLIGVSGNDILSGGEGADTLSGGFGLDTISGGAGNDTIKGSDDDDQITGDEGDDTLEGGSGNDSIDGGPGTDTIIGGPGSDTCTTGETVSQCIGTPGGP